MALGATMKKLQLQDNDFVMVASIDFGTTFSGYAFSFKSSKSEIRMNKNWGEGAGHQSFKTPTSVLLDNKGHFLAFGYEAESKYNELIMNKGEDSCELYRHFKMALHSQERLTRKTKILSVRGTPANAIEIFTHAVRFLKDHLLEAVGKTVTRAPNRDLIRWVITVPAIWSEESKSFMREVAFKAGITRSIDSTLFMICLEPEAASMCCRQLDANQFARGGGGDAKLLHQPGTKYMVVDAGGGTVDITAHEIQGDGRVKELTAASGGAWGGTQVDSNFINLMMKILGKEFIIRYQKECPAEWLDIRVNFEKKKKAVKPNNPDSVLSIQLSWGISAKYKEITGKDIIKVLESTQVQGVKFRNGNIVFSANLIASLFNPVTERIVLHINNELKSKKVGEVGMILLVGGFGECAFLQDAIVRAFSRRFTIVCPHEAGISIIKGAVLLGHTPESVRSRIARKTYGTSTHTQFIPGIHDSHRRVINVRGPRCLTFRTFVRKGEEVNENEVRRFIFYPDWATDTHDQCDIYSVDKENVMYPDDPGVQKLAVLDIWMPDTTGGLEREIEVKVRFGSSELHIAAGVQGRVAETKIDFLTH